MNTPQRSDKNNLDGFTVPGHWPNRAARFVAETWQASSAQQSHLCRLPPMETMHLSLQKPPHVGTRRGAIEGHPA